MPTAEQLLQQYYGHTSFRPGQKTVIDALQQGRDVLAVMPTGAGKSVCYQIPALLFPGLTIVVSPLISLMQDQVAALREMGILAAYLNTALSAQDAQIVLQYVRAGRLKLLYIAPERLQSRQFLSAVSQVPVSLVAVDEAHCVSQWGQDFRPSYRLIAGFVEQLWQRPPVAAFTATATATVQEDICYLLRLQNPVQLTTGFDRPNLYFDVQTPKNKDKYLLTFLRQHPNECGIIYCATRQLTEEVCRVLQEEGILAGSYHAGMGGADRLRTMHDFVYDRLQVIVATNAFGMGIDKSNVNFVIHYNMPKDLESYYQEAGRAGRDGEKASCVLLFSPQDVRTQKFLIENSSSAEELSKDEREALRQRDYKRLYAMETYCKSSECLRWEILRYFGEDAPKHCGYCGNCLGHFAVEDITIQAQKVLSGVARVEQQYRNSFGIDRIVKMLRGSTDAKTLELRLDQIRTYGALREDTDAKVQQYIHTLLDQGYLIKSPGQYPTLHLTEQAKKVLFQGEKVTMRARDAKKSYPVTPPSADSRVDSDLYEALRQVRMELSQREHVPAYLICTNAALKDMAIRHPRTTKQLLQVSGLGKAKVSRYGDAFLEILQEY